MNAAEPADSRALARWRQPWVPIALLAFVVQVAGFWLVSSEPTRTPRRSPPRQDAFLPEPDGIEATLRQDAWRWLFTPAVFLLPSDQDFSGLAWMRVGSGDLEVESLEVPDRPLPWELVRGGPGAEPALPRSDPGPAGRWSPPADVALLPGVGAVPLPAENRVRLLAGLRGRAIVAGGDPGLPADARVPLARPPVVRVTVDESGELADPPVIWESSELPAADEAAVQAARRLRFERGSAGTGVESGLVSPEWAVPVKAAGTNAPPGGEGRR